MKEHVQPAHILEMQSFPNKNSLLEKLDFSTGLQWVSKQKPFWKGAESVVNTCGCPGAATAHLGR